MKLHRYALATFLLLPFAQAHAASFNCAKAHSPAETVICHDATLSKADDELGRLFKLAHHAAPDRRAYRKESDAKWAWREANCTDVACLTDWYTTRIGQIRVQLDKAVRNNDSASASLETWQCTAATHDLIPRTQCSNLLEKQTAWQSRDHASDSWFCGVAMINGDAQW